MAGDRRQLSQDDHARIVKRQVEQLDCTVVKELYAGRGKEAYDPVVLLKMVLYQYLKGRRSQRPGRKKLNSIKRCSGLAMATVPHDALV